jgi:hypothetical protein
VKWVIMNVSDTDFNGQHLFDRNSREHRVTFNEKNIRKSFQAGGRRFGGNLRLQNIDERLAAAMVLAHELQHANQSKSHAGDKNFYGHLGGYTGKGKPRMMQYKNRPCERDARQFVDSHLDEIFAYFEVEAPRRTKTVVPDAEKEILAVVELLLECDKPTMSDVIDELRASKILNPKNVRIVAETLQERGIQLK